jgi:hypothetical protein
MALEEVLEEVSAEVADVGVVVDRRPAGVELDSLAVGVEWNERFEGAGEGVEEADQES